MKEEDLSVGIVVQHKNGNLYKVLDTNALVEDSVEDWQPGIVYTPLYACTTMLFVRRKDSFLKSFEII